jgi:hypothetical protein
MPKSAHEPEPNAGQGTDAPSITDGGGWGLDLWSGTAWFSSWFYQRLNWPAQTKRQRLDDLRPHLSADAWQSLLLGIRAQLELQLPLDVDVRVQLGEGRFQCWRMQGTVERNVGGQPVTLLGSAQDTTADI